MLGRRTTQLYDSPDIQPKDSDYEDTYPSLVTAVLVAVVKKWK